MADGRRISPTPKGHGHQPPLFAALGVESGTSTSKLSLLPRP
jgi:hypothetical protein